MESAVEGLSRLRERNELALDESLTVHAGEVKRAAALKSLGNSKPGSDSIADIGFNIREAEQEIRWNDRPFFDVLVDGDGVKCANGRSGIFGRLGEERQFFR